MAGYVVRIALPTGPEPWASWPAGSGRSGATSWPSTSSSARAASAVDEFVVEIGGEHLIELLQTEIHEVDGVVGPRDPRGGLDDVGGLTT